jgi:hypothetical protein
MSSEIGLKSKGYIFLAGATKIPWMNASSERLAVAPPTHGKRPEASFQPSRRWRRRAAGESLEALFLPQGFCQTRKEFAAESQLAKKGAGKEAKLCYWANAPMENRRALLVDF